MKKKPHWAKHKSLKEICDEIKNEVAYLESIEEATTMRWYRAGKLRTYLGYTIK